jgi:putative hydrolase
VALEINNSSFVHSRKGSEANCREVAAAVRDAGGMVALGSDSHTAFTLGDFSECLKVLNDVNFPEAQILNVTPAACSISSNRAAWSRLPNLPIFNCVME